MGDGDAEGVGLAVGDAAAVAVGVGVVSSGPQPASATAARRAPVDARSVHRVRVLTMSGKYRFGMVLGTVRPTSVDNHRRAVVTVAVQCRGRRRTFPPTSRRSMRVIPAGTSPLGNRQHPRMPMPLSGRALRARRAAFGGSPPQPRPGAR